MNDDEVKSTKFSSLSQSIIYQIHENVDTNRRVNSTGANVAKQISLSCFDFRSIDVLGTHGSCPCRFLQCFDR